MNLLILCAGRGTRLKPLTDHVPKSLLRLDANQTILYRLLRQFNNFFVSSEMWVNISTNAQFFLKYLSEVSENIRPNILYESELLGSANTLFEFSLLAEGTTLVLHGDLVLSDQYVNALMKEIDGVNENLVICHNRSAKNARSLVSRDDLGKVLKFENNFSSLDENKVLVNSGIYLFQDLANLGNRPELKVEISDSVLMYLFKKGGLYAREIEEARISVDSIEKLEKAKELVSKEKYS
jgi:NDP-sugar pyrophosphorylase family protein